MVRGYCGRSGAAALCLVVLVTAGCQATGVPARATPPLVQIVQPGAPGTDARPITPERATDLSAVGVTPADVAFMQGMIGHHAQALDMTELLKSRSERADMQQLARRIELSQGDEIRFMREWLEAHAQPQPDPHAHHQHGAALMPGMLTPEQMAQLAAANGLAFDQLFLERMISHHEGALLMVRDLLQSPGAAQDSSMFGFVSDVEADQRIEIARMGAMLNLLRGTR